MGASFIPPAGKGYQQIGADFSAVFTLLGYQIDPASAPPESEVHFTLYWRKGPRTMPTPTPTRGNPLSMFLHITTDDPSQIISQFDGWRTALRGLEESDIIVMPAVVELDNGVHPGSYTIRAGLYSPQNGTRLSVQERDHVVLGTLEVLP
jgi:hypothetical protein